MRGREERVGEGKAEVGKGEGTGGEGKGRKGKGGERLWTSASLNSSLLYCCMLRFFFIVNVSMIFLTLEVQLVGSLEELTRQSLSWS